MKVPVSKMLNEKIVETLKPSVNSVFQDGLLKISNFFDQHYFGFFDEGI